MFNHDGEIVRWLGTNTDVTAQRDAETHRRLLMEELQHRVKNTLAIVQSIAHQTFRKAVSPEHALENFTGRLMALSRAYDVLLDESWSSAEIANVVSDAIHPHDGGRSRFRVGGPSLRLAGRPALALSMVLHELSTNALKHGALSQENGHVEIVWRIDDSGGEPQLSLTWTERGGPAVAKPTRRSFGTVLIEQGLGPQFGSSATLAYEPAGLVCMVVAPLNAIEEKAIESVA
jgi:two-component system CheB/CheR fusion protein